MNMKYLLGPVFLVGFLIFCCVNLYAENIDPYDDDSQYAYGENVGWLNFEPSQGDGVHVSETQLTGYVWAENIGWINLWPSVYGGVYNDGTGNLSGYAWGQNVGWMNFNPTNGGVTIDADGDFDGWAWGENIGWINFNSTDLYGYNVRVCVVNYYDLANFVDDWLKTGPDWPADLYSDENVDFKDYSIFAGYWLDYCPDGWPLK
ncbi:unnamed protein product [marine sediment metagenome]|uniref:Uncharacterized protein n=1 Tax=marine sediment metagenome TaxID=412755 RepID=X1AXI8_9ZZZZ